MADKTVTYAINTESNAREVGEQGARSLEQLRQSILGSMASIREMGATLRTLRGASDEVKGAKEQLRARIEAERGQVSATNLELLKAGTNYERLAEQTKKAATEQRKLQETQKLEQLRGLREQVEHLDKSMSAAGGPIEGMRGKIDSLKSAMSTAEGRTALFVGGLFALAGAAFEVGRTLADLAERAGRWFVEAGLAQRQANLLREAWTGSATSARALGNQIDEVARKVPTSKEKLNELAGTVVRSLNNSRVSGQGIVDTFNAVAQASASMGDEVGKRLGDLIERSKRFGRVQINPIDVQGTGVQFQDLASNLAHNLGISVRNAQLALATGRVKVDDAAKALRQTVEDRFGQVNAKLRIGEPLENLKKRLLELAKDVHLDGLLSGIEKLESLLDKSSVSGSVLRTAISKLAELFPSFDKGATTLRDIFERIELGAIRVEIQMFKARNAIRKAFAGDDGIEKLGKRIDALLPSVRGFADVMSFTAREMTTSVVMAGKLASFLERLLEANDKLKKGDWKGTGTQIVRGLIDGFVSGHAELIRRVEAMAHDTKAAFARVLGISSPSKVFEQYGKQTAEGAQRGIERGSPAVERAAAEMAPKPGQSAGAAASRATQPTRAAPVKAEITVNLHGVDGQTSKQIVQPNFLQSLTKALTDALVMAGLPVQEDPQP